MDSDSPSNLEPGDSNAQEDTARPDDLALLDLQHADSNGGWRDSVFLAAGERSFDLEEEPREAAVREVDRSSTDSTDGQDNPDGHSILEEGAQCTLPVVWFSDVVMFPGSSISLQRIRLRETREAIQAALAAPPPYERLLAVVRFDDEDNFISRIGCTAELRQGRPGDNTLDNLVAVGRQRIQIDVQDAMSNLFRGHQSCCATVLPEDVPSPVPDDFRESRAYWGMWVARMYDSYRLAQKLYAASRDVFPDVRYEYDNPLQLSYVLASNMPFSSKTRQSLLEKSSALERLKMEYALIKKMSNLLCGTCETHLSHIQDVICIEQDSLSKVFVNPFGFTYDIVTVSQVRNVSIGRGTEVQHSWFPGYAWTPAYCISCASQLGWKFTPASEDVSQQSFWGLRCSQLYTAGSSD